MVGGWFGQAELGTGGGKVSFGRAVWSLEDREFLPKSGALGLKVSILRTWGSPVNAPSDQTFVGPEAEVAAFRSGVFPRLRALGLR